MILLLFSSQEIFSAECFFIIVDMVIYKFIYGCFRLFFIMTMVGKLKKTYECVFLSNSFITAIVGIYLLYCLINMVISMP